MPLRQFQEAPTHPRIYQTLRKKSGDSQLVLDYLKQETVRPNLACSSSRHDMTSLACLLEWSDGVVVHCIRIKRPDRASDGKNGRLRGAADLNGPL